MPSGSWTSTLTVLASSRSVGTRMVSSVKLPAAAEPGLTVTCASAAAGAASATTAANAPAARDFDDMGAPGKAGTSDGVDAGGAPRGGGGVRGSRPVESVSALDRWRATGGADERVERPQRQRVRD